MSRVKEVSQLIKGGQNLQDIEAELGLSLASILDYLRRGCGYGYITRSDIYFAIPRLYRALFYIYDTFGDSFFYQQRAVLESQKDCSTLTGSFHTQLEEAKQKALEIFDVDLEELPWNMWDRKLRSIYLEFSQSDSLRADLYADIAELELIFNRFIREVLTRKFGAGESGWWRKGIKDVLRAELVKAREMDEEPADDPLCYLSFIHIRDILKSNWETFTPYFSKNIHRDPKKLQNLLVRVNRIRNQVMHPIKNARHTYADLELVHACLKEVEWACRN